VLPVSGYLKVVKQEKGSGPLAIFRDFFGSIRILSVIFDAVIFCGGMRDYKCWGFGGHVFNIFKPKLLALLDTVIQKKIPG